MPGVSLPSVHLSCSGRAIRARTRTPSTDRDDECLGVLVTEKPGTEKACFRSRHFFVKQLFTQKNRISLVYEEVQLTYKRYCIRRVQSLNGTVSGGVRSPSGQHSEKHKKSNAVCTYRRLFL